MYTLASRSAVAAVDGAPVPAVLQNLPVLVESVVATFLVTVTGAPTAYDARAAIEMSPDGGTTWHQVVRFKDVTNAAPNLQVVRGASITAISEVDIVASVLGNAAAAAVLFDTPWSSNLRAVTKLQTLTAGTAPTVTFTVLLDVSD